MELEAVFLLFAGDGKLLSVELLVKMVDLRGVEPLCLIIFRQTSTSLVLLNCRHDTVILYHDCFGEDTHLVHHFKMVSLL